MNDLTEDKAGLAAEYVLGTLTAEEYAAATALRHGDAALETAILDWERRLAPLLLAVPDATPSSELWSRIEKQLNPPSVVPFPRRPEIAALQRQVNLWRAGALAASLVAFLALGANFLRPAAPVPLAPTLVASLQKEVAAPAFLIGLDEIAQTFKVVALGGPAPAGKDYELWIIADGLPAPRSLGVMRPDTVSLKPDLSGLSPAAIHGATLAVSVEPTGGSPTGSATGEVVFTGKFVAARL